MVINWSKKCNGSWMWTKKFSKSAINYAITFPDIYIDVKIMMTDEDGNMGTIGADLNFMEVCLKGTIKLQKVAREIRQRWAFTGMPFITTCNAYSSSN